MKTDITDIPTLRVAIETAKRRAVETQTRAREMTDAANIAEAAQQMRPDTTTAEECIAVNAEAIQRLQEWSEPYPTSVFPAPDMAAAHEALRSRGMSLDAVAASVYREVLRKVMVILREGIPEAGK